MCAIFDKLTLFSMGGRKNSSYQIILFFLYALSKKSGLACGCLLSCVHVFILEYISVLFKMCVSMYIYFQSNEYVFLPESILRMQKMNQFLFCIQNIKHTNV
mmetsp:Transcript_33739/g.49205  ORF Transcript_33739/g.49205 Transcript_33739/m.49205 type:complete len:102 (+) Transcript_33739:452-757(+)